ncbi:hypothetical protein U4960_06140 [Altererythrobacter sp. H2]|uniref:hypothetical protein n=1 Tax=Altererythrobacter sp. H2 TaxID=3108391 RepID=UPI002B4C020B|nr:hypothetical protein [Altererythrobacter sp. H2]WRK96894.1 hypothetical protein U4960_06140 [Altererythrobacter sp. H2]
MPYAAPAPDPAAEPSLYLIWHDPGAAPARPLDLHGDGYPLAGGLWLVRSALTRSRLYHRIKWQLPEGTPLACAPLADEPDGWPKFRGMEPGALAWLRGR